VLPDRTGGIEPLHSALSCASMHMRSTALCMGESCSTISLVTWRRFDVFVTSREP
jgi:hypothetical protein